MMIASLSLGIAFEAFVVMNYVMRQMHKL